MTDTFASTLHARVKSTLLAVLTAALSAACVSLEGTVDSMAEGPAIATGTASYIVQAASVGEARALVQAEGGIVTHELDVIRAVAAELSSAGVEALRQDRRVHRVYDNGGVETAGRGGKGGKTGNTGSGNYTSINTDFAQLVHADELHSMGITGAGVGIAVLDTGLWKHDGIRYDHLGNPRIRALYNAITGVEASSPLSGDDPPGHGSHVASIAVSSLMTPDGYYNGIAPGAHLVSVQAFDETGQGTYADVIRAIDWIVANKARHKIRVLNLSFSAEPRSYYWDDPINQAVMVAWQNEIFVVAAAGNRGPDPMTIGVPGNVPYVMTVGAVIDNYSPSDLPDDELASFSSAGPTFEGFVKPEVVAPGGHMLGLVQGNSLLATTYPEFYASDMYSEMSGTSQATAVVAGIAALVIEAEAWRSVDQLKCKIMSAARPAVTGSNQALAYSVFQQGAGLVDARSAAFNQNVDCANGGQQIDNDIDGFQHFGGRRTRWPEAVSSSAATSMPVKRVTAGRGVTATPPATCGPMATSGRTAISGPPPTS